MFWIIITAALVLDIVSKRLVVSGMGLDQVISVIPGVFDLHYIRNYGAAFSIMQNKRIFLIAVTVIMMAGLCVYAVKMGNKISKAERIALAMIVGGGIGNLIDRIFLGYVTDFLCIYIIPIFNVADCFVTVGCALLIIAVLTEKKEENERS